jgi:hypothetical protein
MRARTSPRALAAVLLVVLGAALLVSGVLQSRTRLSNWSAEYPLLIGNERTGDRPWRGRLRELAIADAALPLETVRRFAAGEPIQLRGSSIAAFDFAGNAPYVDATGHLPPLAWTETAHAPQQRTAIALAGRPWLESEGPASRLAADVHLTNAFALRVECASDDPTQDGPARIVSNSQSPYRRNFTLGQRRADLVFRLRTPVTGLNGYPLETVVPNVFATNQWQDILVVYDGATLVAAVAHRNEVVRTELTPGAALTPLIASLSSDHRAGYELRGATIMYLVAFYAAPGLIIGVLGRGWRDRIVWSTLYSMAAAALLEATLVMSSGRAFEPANSLVAAAVGAVVFAMVGLIVAPVDLGRYSARADWMAA